MAAFFVYSVITEQEPGLVQELLLQGLEQVLLLPVPVQWLLWLSSLWLPEQQRHRMPGLLSLPVLARLLPEQERRLHRKPEHRSLPERQRQQRRRQPGLLQQRQQRRQQLSVHRLKQQLQRSRHLLQLVRCLFCRRRGPEGRSRRAGGCSCA
jgi:hypothetical protein